MTIIAGIDEAGFGPVMGPLVVSASVLEVPEELSDKCLWQALSPAVTRTNFRKSPRLPVADSKLLRVRSDGLVHIERGVLGMLSLMGHHPQSLRQLLAVVAPGVLPALEEYPWYARTDLPLPRAAGATDILLRSNALGEVMRQKQVRLLDMRAEPVLTADYNRMVSATRNKASALLDVVCRLVWPIATAYPARCVRLTVDHLGGRIRYLPALQRLFEGAAIKIKEESENCSSYVVDYRGRRLEIDFRIQGESCCLATALASMISKYLRELFMELENAWWCCRVEGLRPTAGYYGDGTRFLKQIQQAAQQHGLDRNLFVRLR